MPSAYKLVAVVILRLIMPQVFCKRCVIKQLSDGFSHTGHIKLCVHLINFILLVVCHNLNPVLWQKDKTQGLRIVLRPFEF